MGLLRTNRQPKIEKVSASDLNAISAEVNARLPIASAGRPYVMGYAGTIAVGQLVPVLPVWEPCSLLMIIVRMPTAPVGAAAIYDVTKNGRSSGDTIFTDQTKRPTVAAGTFLDVTPAADADSSKINLVAGDYLALDIDQVGSTVPGSDPTFVFVLLPSIPTS